MPERKLRETLSDLNGQLEATESLDPGLREQLRGLLRDIQARLDEPERAPEHDRSLGDRLSEAAEQFEEGHPALTGAVGRVIDALAAMGI